GPKWSIADSRWGDSCNTRCQAHSRTDCESGGHAHLPESGCSEVSNYRRLTPMINTTRKEILRILEELSDQHPHWRFGQLVANMAGIADVNIWDLEDDQLLAVARNHLEHRPQADGDN